MEYRICDASSAQLAQLEALEQACFSLPWTREQLESQLPDEQHCFLVALEGNRVLGYIGMMHVLDEGYISNVAVAPDARRRGIGGQLTSISSYTMKHPPVQYTDDEAYENVEKFISGELER